MKSKWLFFMGVLLSSIGFAQSVPSLSEINKQQQQDVQAQNQQLMKQMGYDAPPTQDRISNGRYYDDLSLKREAMQRELYNEISNANLSSKNESTKQQELKSKLRMADTNSADYKTYKICYEKSYSELLKMLDGITPLNIKYAVYLAESPYYKNKLSYGKYCRQIDSLIYICRQVLQKEGLSDKNYMACHYVIQKLFSERIIYKTSSGKEMVFEPLGYDFSIYEKAEVDLKEQFVSRLLTIKKGQCHSLPLLYLVLAEELNVNAYLALAPNHSYVKFGNQNQSFSFETTNGTLTSDAWVVSSGYISASAIKNRIYLSPLSKKEVIAECLNDLAEGLESQCGKSDFTLKCCQAVLKYFPNSIRAVLEINNMLVAKCAKTADSYHFPKFNDYAKYPELKKQFDQMTDFELKVEATGYQKIPKEQYELWRKSANEEKERREHLKYLSELKQFSK